MFYLYDSENKIMKILWEKGSMTAKEISVIAAERLGWNKNTTYTVLKKMVAKGYLKRTDPAFFCEALISRQEVEKQTTRTLIDKIFDGSRTALFSALLKDEKLSKEELEELRKLMEEHE